MSSGALKVVVTQRLPAQTEARMAELFDMRFGPEQGVIAPLSLAEALLDAEVLVPTLMTRVDAALLELAPKLRLIANYGAGVDHIDLSAAQARGVLVTNTPSVAAEDTADMAMALILAVTRRMPEGLHKMQAGEWDGWSPLAMTGGRIRGRKLGIVGLGRIGRATARRARAFGMEIHYHSRHRLRAETEAELGAIYWQSLDQMLAAVDVLTIHTPATPATYHLLNERRLRLMKPDAVIVNTARGEVIDENALTRALREGRLAGAGLDVYERGASINPRLRALPSVVLLPHMGSATREGRLEMGERVILNIRAFADGHPLPDRVLP